MISDDSLSAHNSPRTVYGKSLFLSCKNLPLIICLNRCEAFNAFNDLFIKLPAATEFDDDVAC